MISKIEDLPVFIPLERDWVIKFTEGEAFEYCVEQAELAHFNDGLYE